MYTMIKLGQMVLKGNLGTQYKNQVIWWLKGVNWVHNDKLGQMVLKGAI